MIVVHDTSANYYLDTPYVMKNKQQLFRRAVGKIRQLSSDADLAVRT
jgi:hypothetical protein